MSDIEEDPILGRFFDTTEKKVKWLIRIKIAYIVFIIFLIVGISYLILWNL